MERPASPARAWTAVALLTFAYIVSFIDRTIISLLIGPIRADLQISDTQFSLLHGLAFAFFYTLLGIPVARLADHHSRRLIIGTGILLWSVMTAAGALSRNFTQLFLARVGVGIGEAALSPAAYSLMADMVDRERLGRATGIYGSGVYVGTGLSFIVGGWLIDRLAEAGPVTLPVIGTLAPWQQILLIAGLPGPLLALAMMTLPNPPRRGRAVEGDGKLFAFLRSDFAFLATLFAGAAIIAIIFNGYLGWGVEYFVREHGWSKTRAGLSLGLIILAAGSSGVVAGGLLTDYYARQGRPDPAMRAILLGVTCLLPWPFIASTTPSVLVSLLGFAPLVFFASLIFTPIVVVTQTRAPRHLRAQVSAVYLFVANLVGIAAGSTAIALVSDKLLGGTRLGLAMGIVGVLAGLIGTALLFACARLSVRKYGSEPLSESVYS